MKVLSYIFDKTKNVMYIVHKRSGVTPVNRVKAFRKKAGLTQMALAREVNVARQTINLIENGKYNPSLSLCISLAKALGTDLNALFWEEEST